jgi:hypothetical protein
MRQTTPITNECSPEKKTKFAELNAELRDLKSAENLADYERCKGTLPELEWEKLKERINDRFQKVLEERNKIYN